MGLAILLLFLAALRRNAGEGLATADGASNELQAAFQWEGISILESKASPEMYCLCEYTP